MNIINNKFFFLLLYTSLIFGFFINENLNYGSIIDWETNGIAIKDFSNDLSGTLLNYDTYYHRHSPLYLVFLSFFYKLGLSLDLIRLIHLHLCLSLVLIFYKCLKLKFEYVNREILKILSLIVILSPTFRSISIWPDTRIPGLILFILAVYYFLKFMHSPKYKYVWFCSIWLIISSYISPNFSIFSIYFYFIFYKQLSVVKFSKLILFNLIASMPILFYLFVLDVNFLTAGKTPGLDGENVSLNFNLSNKILIISSIIFFHLLPVFIYTLDYKKFFNFLRQKKIQIFVLSLILFYFFNYNSSLTGGGFFFQLSQFFFGNDFLFFFISFFSLSILFYLFSLNFNNFFIITLIILSNIQMTIYHKYYEPLILIIFFLLFKNLDYKNFFLNKKSLLSLYIYSIFFIIMRLVKNVYLV